jgi:hypothetical protein
MRFTLNYRGPLKSNGGAPEKLALRRHFHPQMRELWGQPLLRDRRDKLNGKGEMVREVGNFRFMPLVAPRLHLLAELRIVMLRPADGAMPSERHSSVSAY